MATPKRKRSGGILAGTSVYHARLRACKTQMIREALAECRGNRTHAARALGVQRTYFIRLMRDLSLRTTAREA